MVFFSCSRIFILLDCFWDIFLLIPTLSGIYSLFLITKSNKKLPGGWDCRLTLPHLVLHSVLSSAGLGSGCLLLKHTVLFITLRRTWPRLRSSHWPLFYLSHSSCNFKGQPGFKGGGCVYQVTFKYGFIFIFQWTRLRTPLRGVRPKWVAATSLYQLGTISDAANGHFNYPTASKMRD